MKRIETAMVLVSLVAFFTFAALGEGRHQPQANFLSLLKTGQEIALKEVAGRYEISLMDDLPLSHKITAIGPDFLVVEDTAGVVESRIPVYSIRSIVTLKTPKN
jgi:hypothetical protein